MTNQEILAIDPSFAFHLEHIDKLRQDIRFEKERLQRRSSLREHLRRAFGIHLILATQRPDANILSGQIKNNVNCRICGRADTILSQIILDSTAAAEPNPQGCPWQIHFARRNGIPGLLV
jgi:S-DNA-T family DNA segregation ATPase FtsK/SpoIIIE